MNVRVLASICDVDDQSKWALPGEFYTVVSVYDGNQRVRLGQIEIGTTIKMKEGGKQIDVSYPGFDLFFRAL